MLNITALDERQTLERVMLTDSVHTFSRARTMSRIWYGLLWTESSRWKAIMRSLLTAERAHILHYKTGNRETAPFLVGSSNTVTSSPRTGSSSSVLWYSLEGSGCGGTIGLRVTTWGAALLATI